MRTDVIGRIHNDLEVFQSCLEGGAISKGGAVEEIGEVLDSLLLRAKPERGSV